MWKSKLALALALLLGSLPLAARSRNGSETGVSSFMKSQPAKDRGFDKNELKDQAAETQPLLDALARETRRLDKEAKLPLIRSLDREYGLGTEAKEARRLLERQEAAQDLEDAVRVEKARLEAAEPGPGRRASLERLEGLEKERLARAQDLLNLLMDQHKRLKENASRDYRTWMMVWEGRLRQRREAAEAAAPKPSPQALSAQGLSPAAAAAPLPGKLRKRRPPAATPGATPAAAPAAAGPRPQVSATAAKP